MSLVEKFRISQKSFFSSELFTSQLLRAKISLIITTPKELNSSTNTTFHRQTLTVTSNNIGTPKFKAQPTNAFSLASIRCSAALPSFPLLQTRSVIKWNRWAKFRKHSLKLTGAAEHLIDGSNKCICRFSFEFWSPHVTNRCSKISGAYLILAWFFPSMSYSNKEVR